MPAFARLLGLLLVLATVAPVLAHLDPPTTPTIFVVVRIDRLQLLQDMDDGLFDGDAEVGLAWAVGHDGHGSNSGTEFKDGVDWDAGGTWEINQVIWMHDECTPMSHVSVGFAVVESDQDSADFTKLALSGAGRLLVAGIIANPIGLGVAAVTTVGSLIVWGLNGDDDLGSAGSGTGSPGSFSTEVRGEDGGVRIDWSVTTTPLDLPGCHVHPPPLPPVPTPGSPPKPPSLPTPGDRTAGVEAAYGLRDAVWAIQRTAGTTQMEVEVRDRDGTVIGPEGMTPLQYAKAQASAPSIATENMAAGFERLYWGEDVANRDRARAEAEVARAFQDQGALHPAASHYAEAIAWLFRAPLQPR